MFPPVDAASPDVFCVALEDEDVFLKTGKTLRKISVVELVSVGNVIRL